MNGKSMQASFIDTHCHFDFPPFAGNEVFCLRNAYDAGVNALIVPAVTSERFTTVMHLAKRYPALFFALGIHPLYLAKQPKQQLDQSLSLLTEMLQRKEKKCVAIGEIGLDFFEKSTQRSLQLSIFEEQLALAKQHDIPVILHSRRAHDVMLASLKKWKLPCAGVVHGFAGSLEQAKSFIQQGYLLGVGGTITYERAKKTRSAIAVAPLASLLLETDAPDMPVSGYQREPNRPERIADIFKALCELRPEPADEIIQQILLNTRRLFAIP